MVAPGVGEPNLVHNLSEVIRQQAPELDRPLLVYPTQSEEEPLMMSIDAVGAAVRSRLGELDFIPANDESVVTVAGSLLLGYSLASDEIASRRQEYPIDWPSNVGQLPKPWQVESPILLDPVLWMLGTALQG
jgi:hypothetical protein